MHTMYLTDRQAISYLTLASQTDTLRFGGPSMAQVHAVNRLPGGDRSAVMSQFGHAVISQLPADVMAAIHAACERVA